ncbi:hypothetical protein GEV33_012541 [Tenebrio molitor]|uniref:Uncharacterized protein n=1 Tax=Tenebrio molitor TaxID=7067 RepID=A0A8J6H9D0_TENMO|nr:hypothetical protein GEV33_012541 [Tenebrio molitor]
MTSPRRCKFGTTIVLSNKSAIGDGRESQCQQCQKKKNKNVTATALRCVCTYRGDSNGGQGAETPSSLSRPPLCVCGASLCIRPRCNCTGRVRCATERGREARMKAFGRLRGVPCTAGGGLASNRTDTKPRSGHLVTAKRSRPQNTPEIAKFAAVTRGKPPKKCRRVPPVPTAD